jgi:phosphoglucosamine mutase
LECGSLYPQKAVADVLKYRADIGICLDGDADRVVIIDNEGHIIDGDQLIGILARLLLEQGIMKPGMEVVGTVMSNLGLENYIKSLGLKFARTQVGDRYIVEYMRDTGAVLGGEPSGHIIFKQHSTTGDGLLAALKVIECQKIYKKNLKELASSIKLYPQVLKNVPVHAKLPFDTVPGILKVLKEVETKLGDKGRVLLRYSGTEFLARVMVEAENEKIVHKMADKLVEVVSKELG